MLDTTALPPRDERDIPVHFVLYHYNGEYEFPIGDSTLRALPNPDDYIELHRYPEQLGGPPNVLKLRVLRTIHRIYDLSFSGANSRGERYQQNQHGVWIIVEPYDRDAEATLARWFPPKKHPEEEEE